MKYSLSYEPSDEKDRDEIPNDETLKAMKEAEEIAAAWLKRKRG